VRARLRTLRGLADAATLEVVLPMVLGEVLIRVLIR
jgi:hypothetical protein